MKINRYLKGSIMPEKSWKWQNLENKIHQIAKVFNFKEIRPMIIQDRSSISECYKIKDETIDVKIDDFVYELKENDMALRPEATLQILSEIKNNDEMDNPQRLYYFGPMFRKSADKMNVRQFHQFGCEYTGTDSLFAEVELIRLGLKFFEELGLFNIKIELASYGCSMCKPMLQKSNCKESNISDDNNCKENKQNKIVKSNHLCRSCRLKMYKLEKYLSNLMINWEENSSLQRTFSYYNNAVFNFVSYDGDKRTVLGGGGRYDFLASRIMDSPYQAVGFSIDIDPLIDILDKKQLMAINRPDFGTYFVAENESLELPLLQVSQDFVKENMPFIVSSTFGFTDELVDEARRKKALGIIVFEDDLANEGKAKIVNIVKDKVEVVPIGELLEYFLRLKKSIVHTMHY
jgi:histidyl-tRNA synthetase